MNKNKVYIVLSYILIPIIGLLTMISLAAGIYKSHINDYSLSDNYFKDVFYAEMRDATKNMIFNNELMNMVKTEENRIIYIGEGSVGIRDLEFAIYYNDLIITNVPLTDKNISKEAIEDTITKNRDEKNLKSYRLKNGVVETDAKALVDSATEKRGVFEYEYYKLTEDEELKSEEVIDQEINEQLENLDIIAEENYDDGIIHTTINDFEVYATFNDKIKNYLFDVYKNYSFFGEYATLICPFGVLLISVLLYVIIKLTGKDENGELNIKLSGFDNMKLELFAIFEAALFTLACVFAVYFLDRFDFRKDVNYSPLISAILIGYAGFVFAFDSIIKRIKTKTFWKNSYLYSVSNFIADVLKTIKVYLDNNYSKSTTTILFGLILAFVAVSLIGFLGLLGMILVAIIVSILAVSLMKKSNEIQKDASESKMKNERLKAELITNVSHDIKTPLTSIINYIDLLKKEDLNNEKAKEYIKVLDEKSQRLKKLTEDLIEVSKASSGNLKLIMENIDVVELINQALGEFEDKFKAKNLNVELVSSSKHIYVDSDSRYMFRIIENLFSNIEKYALDSTRVYINVEEKNGKVVLSFKNTSKEKLNISEEELMQRFVRGDKSRNTEGSGLGLAIVSSLTESLKGEYNLKIDGDLFKITLTFIKYQK